MDMERYRNYVEYDENEQRTRRKKEKRRAYYQKRVAAGLAGG